MTSPAPSPSFIQRTARAATACGLYCASDLLTWTAGLMQRSGTGMARAATALTALAKRIEPPPPPNG